MILVDHRMIIIAQQLNRLMKPTYATSLGIKLISLALRVLSCEQPPIDLIRQWRSNTLLHSFGLPLEEVIHDASQHLCNPFIGLPLCESYAWSSIGPQKAMHDLALVHTSLQPIDIIWHYSWKRCNIIWIPEGGVTISATILSSYKSFLKDVYWLNRKHASIADSCQLY